MMINNINRETYFRNEKEHVLKVKEIIANTIVFDEQGKEYALPRGTFLEYLNQEKYKEVKLSKEQKMEEVRRILENNSIIDTLKNLL